MRLHPGPKFLPSLALAAIALTAGTAHADSAPLWTVELRSGVAQPSYSGGDYGLAYGFATGGTFRLGASPLRLYVLGNLTARNADLSGYSAGQAFTADRRDVDAYGSLRLVLPIVNRFRVYGEGGFGYRWARYDLQRRGPLGLLAAGSGEPIAVLAGGLQYRFSDNFSLGLRAEISPSLSGVDVLEELTGSDPAALRAAALLQVGFHF